MTTSGLLVLIFGWLIAACVFAQDAPAAPSATKTSNVQQRSLVDFTKPQPHFPRDLGTFPRALRLRRQKRANDPHQSLDVSPTR